MFGWLLFQQLLGMGGSGVPTAIPVAGCTIDLTGLDNSTITMTAIVVALVVLTGTDDSTIDLTGKC